MTEDGGDRMAEAEENCFTAEAQRALRNGVFLRWDFGVGSRTRAHDEKIALWHGIANVNTL